jgi:(2Fe-2S) ferredoxin
MTNPTTNPMTKPMTNHFQYHVFFCLNQREDGASCCMDKGAGAAFDHMKARVKKLGLNGPDKVRINRAGCFDRCGEGPLLVVYPQAIWYTFVDNEDIDEIIDSHLINGNVVERLVI